MGRVRRIKIGDGGRTIGVDQGISNVVVARRARRISQILKFQGIRGSPRPVLEIGLLNSYGTVHLVQGHNEAGHQDHGLVVADGPGVLPLRNLLPNGIRFLAIHRLPHLDDASGGRNDIAIVERNPPGRGLGRPQLCDEFWDADARFGSAGDEGVGVGLGGPGEVAARDSPTF